MTRYTVRSEMTFQTPETAVLYDWMVCDGCGNVLDEGGKPPDEEGRKKMEGNRLHMVGFPVRTFCASCNDDKREQQKE